LRVFACSVLWIRNSEITYTTVYAKPVAVCQLQYKCLWLSCLQLGIANRFSNWRYTTSSVTSLPTCAMVRRWVGRMTRIITVTRFLRAHVLSPISAMRLALLHSCFNSNSEIHLSRYDPSIT